jgi:hypothetical protein
MTERKPTGVSFESWADRQIREAAARGEFDDLPGAGKPIQNIDRPYDEVWVMGLMRREGHATEDLLPTPPQLRRERERLQDAVRDLSSESAVRDVVAELNERILAWLRAPLGAPVAVATVDVEQVVERWRAQRRQ